MRILIIGAGDAGKNLAAKLCEMSHDVVVIDRSAERLATLEARFDILTVQGSGSSPDVLETAEVEKADLLIAVTNLDEVNILACQYAHAAGVPYTVARISDPSIVRSKRLNFQELGVDLMISHKEVAAEEIFDILRYPGLLESVDLLDGRVLAAGIRIESDSPLLEAPLGDFTSEAIFTKIRFVAVLRQDRLSIPHGDTCFMAGDDVYVAVKPADLAEFLNWACPGRQPFDKVVVAGGGDLGLEVARRLDTVSIPAVLLERNAARAEVCAKALHEILVLHGNASDQETLINAGVGPNTAFVAVTGDQELNIISCILADKMGAALTVANVAKPEYVPIIKSLSLLDRVVSPHLSMINAILHFVRGKHIKAAARLHKVPGEFLHVAIRKRHRWAGKMVRQLKVPSDSVIVTVLRGDEIRVPTGDLTIEAGDQLVMFALPEKVEQVLSLFKN